MKLDEMLKTKVNSAMVTFENHNYDNSFFESRVRELERQLEGRKYEVVGVCKNIPFRCAGAENSVAFVYKFEDEIYWCHMPEDYWFILLRQYYGHDEANKIIKSILG